MEQEEINDVEVEEEFTETEAGPIPISKLEVKIYLN